MASLRQNLTLKVISLAAAILLYVYVRAEHNPIVSRTLMPPIFRENVPPDVEVDGVPDRVEVQLTGPGPLVDSLKVSDVRVSADFQGVSTHEAHTEHLHLQCALMGLPPDKARAVSCELTTPTIRVVLYPRRIRRMPVEAVFPNQPPLGFRYGQPVIRPSQIGVGGRVDRVGRVARLVVTAVLPEGPSDIDGEYEVSARDAQNNKVEGLTLEPPVVRLQVSLRPEPSTKIVPISPSVRELPLPPYQIYRISVTPGQVRIAGRPKRLEEISTITTRDISARDFAETREVEVGLLVPSNVRVETTNGEPVAQIKVRLSIRKLAGSSAVPLDPGGKPPENTIPPGEQRP